MKEAVTISQYIQSRKEWDKIQGIKSFDMYFDIFYASLSNPKPWKVSLRIINIPESLKLILEAMVSKDVDVAEDAEEDSEEEVEVDV